MTADPKRAVQHQFGRQASWYTTSSVHAEGLAEVVGFAAPSSEALALDIATGTGFTAFAIAARCRRVIGLDLTPGMIREARRLAGERGIRNLLFCLGDADALPFADGAFDLVTCRFASHHFPDLPRALSEMARVVRSGGRVVVEDTCAPEAREMAALMNEWELMRDPSHIANQPPSRLRALLEASGLAVEATAMSKVPQEFDDWARRGGVAPGDAAALRTIFLEAPADARDAFRIKLKDGDVHFAWDETILLGIKR
jgi:ubiquinone/menaquinone biosynthesis C-methylase UbiE